MEPCRRATNPSWGRGKLLDRESGITRAAVQCLAPAGSNILERWVGKEACCGNGCRPSAGWHQLAVVTAGRTMLEVHETSVIIRLLSGLVLAPSLAMARGPVKTLLQFFV